MRLKFAICAPWLWYGQRTISEVENIFSKTVGELFSGEKLGKTAFFDTWPAPPTGHHDTNGLGVIDDVINCPIQVMSSPLEKKN